MAFIVAASGALRDSPVGTCLVVALAVVAIEWSSGLYQLNYMTIGIAGQESPPEPQRAVWELDRCRRKDPEVVAPEQCGCGVQVGYHDRGLPMEQVVGSLIRRVRPAIGG